MLTINENHKKLIVEREIILHLFLEYIQIIPNKILLFVNYSTTSVTVSLEKLNKNIYVTILHVKAVILHITSTSKCYGETTNWVDITVQI
jgi:hypothetical protein